MSPLQAASIAAQDSSRAELTDRVVTGLWILLAVGISFVPVDYLRLHGSLPAVHLVQALLIGLTVAALVFVRKIDESLVEWLAVAMLVIGCAASAAIGVLTGNTQTTALLSIAAVLTAATTLPWRARAQAVAAAAATTIITVSGVAARGNFTLLASPEMAAFVIVMVASVWVAGGMQRQRRARAQSDALQRLTEHHKTALLDLARALSATAESQPLLDAITSHASRALDGDMAAIFRWHEASQVFRAVSHFGVPQAPPEQAHQVQFRRREPFGGRLGQGETVRINEITHHPKLPITLLNRLGARHLVATQMRCDDRNEGFLVVLRRGDVGFNDDDERLIEGIASQASSALERAMLLQSTREDAQVSASLAELSQRLLSAPGTQAVYDLLSRHCAESLRAETSYVWLRDEADHSYHAVAQYGDREENWQMTRTVKMEELGPYATRLARERIVVATGDEILQLPRGEWARALGVTRLVHIALERGDKLFGSITCSYTQPPFEWTALHQRIADGIWRVASLAIENAHLIEALERASRVKTDFVSTMSHELRTPLNVIIGYNDLLLDDAFGPTSSEQRDTIRRVRQHSQALLALINQTLDVGKLETGGLTVEVEVREVADLFAELDADTKELQDKPGVAVHWQAAPSLPRLFTDVAKLKMALRNLVHNAIKFTDAGEIVIRAQARDGGVEISVRDSGIGIAGDALGLIFEAFQQADSAPNRRFDGVGLGLYISRRLVDLLGGTLAVESQEGVGSTFRLWMPERYRDDSATPAQESAAAPPR